MLYIIVTRERVQSTRVLKAAHITWMVETGWCTRPSWNTKLSCTGATTDELSGRMETCIFSWCNNSLEHRQTNDLISAGVFLKWKGVVLLKVDHFGVIFGQKNKDLEVLRRFSQFFRDVAVLAIGSNHGCLVCLVERQCFVMSLSWFIFHMHYIIYCYYQYHT